jgi:hypothetical protein
MSVRRDALMMTGGVTEILYHSVWCLSGKGADPDPSCSIREKRKCFGGFSLLDRGYSDC